MTAEEILQKHVPNRYPKSNRWIDAMEAYKIQVLEDIKKEMNKLPEEDQWSPVLLIEKKEVLSVIDKYIK